MKQTYYFSHDYNARHDRKLKNLAMKEGMGGVGIFWCIIEMLYEEGGHLPIADCERIAFELRTDKESVNKVINNYELFEIADDMFTNRSLLQRLNMQKSKSEKARKSAKIKWERHYANAERTHSERYAIKESKVKEKKIKENTTPPNPQRGDVDRVVEIYERIFKTKLLSMSPVRRAKISARLKTFTVEQIEQAIEFYGSSPWHQGENDRGWKADLDFIIRNDEQIEKALTKQIKKPREVYNTLDNPKMKKFMNDYLSNQQNNANNQP